MAGKTRNRIPLELSTWIDIDSLGLARHPKGWVGRGKSVRATRLQHLRGAVVFAETTLRAQINPAGGLVVIEHCDAHGARIEQSVELAAAPMPRGGQRWFFACPVTGGHARKLYRFPGSQQFCSRKGLPAPITYHCQRDSGAKRVMRQIWELRRRLGDKGTLFSVLDKPDEMSNAEYIQHASRYLELADRLEFSTTGIKVKAKRRRSRP